MKTNNQVTKFLTSNQGLVALAVAGGTFLLVNHLLKNQQTKANYAMRAIVSYAADTVDSTDVATLKNTIMTDLYQGALNPAMILDNLDAIKSELNNYDTKLTELVTEKAAGRIPQTTVDYYLKYIAEEIAQKLNIQLMPSGVPLPSPAGVGTVTPPPYYGGYYPPPGYYYPPGYGYGDDDTYDVIIGYDDYGRPKHRRHHKHHHHHHHKDNDGSGGGILDGLFGGSGGISIGGDDGVNIGSGGISIGGDYDNNGQPIPVDYPPYYQQQQQQQQPQQQQQTYYPPYYQQPDYNAQYQQYLQTLQQQQAQYQGQYGYPSYGYSYGYGYQQPNVQPQNPTQYYNYYPQSQTPYPSQYDMAAASSGAGASNYYYQ